MPRVNPKVFIWARETAGYEPPEAAGKLGLKDTKRQRGVDKLLAMERGETEPTRAQLLRMSQQYHRPLLLFYLDAVPVKGDRGEDFRTLPANYSVTDDARVDAIVRDVRTRQDVLRSALEAEYEDDDEDRRSLEFIGARAMQGGVAAMVEYLRQVLGFSAADFRRHPGVDEAFAFARARVESIGVFVVLMGDLGSYHSAVDVNVFRGFALADKTAPFIVINDRDAREAWTFTLLHELAHLCLGLTGISAQRGDSAVEQFCNNVATEFLLPDAELATLAGQQLRVVGMDSLRAAIEGIAGPRLLSRSLVAYRLLRVGFIHYEQWQEVSATFRDEWLENRQRERERKRERDGGPNYYVVRRHRLGAALLSTVSRLLYEKELTTTKAALVLAIKPAHVAAMMASGEKKNLVA